MSEPRGPLSGVRILDLSTFSPVRFGTMVAADLGADVIQVDRPRSAFRDDAPLLTSVEHPRWVWHSRNKRSLGLDLRQPGARELLLRVVAEVDVVIEGFAVGAAARLGLDHASLSAVRPDLVTASVTGFGQTGPNATIPGHEGNYQAMSGVTAAVAAVNSGRPAILPFPMCDSIASLYAVIGILSALRRRDATGEGAQIDISIQDAMFSMFGYPAQYLWLGEAAREDQIEELGGAASSSAYACSDGLAVVINAAEPSVWRRFCAFVGRSDLIDIGSDPERRAHVRAEIEKVFRERTREEWLAASEANGLALTAILSLRELLTDQHLVARGMIAQVDHPTLGSVRQVATPVTIDGEVPDASWFAVPGSHSREVLRDVAIMDEEIDELIRSGIVFDGEAST